MGQEDRIVHDIRLASYSQWPAPHELSNTYNHGELQELIIAAFFLWDRLFNQIIIQKFILQLDKLVVLFKFREEFSLTDGIVGGHANLAYSKNGTPRAFDQPWMTLLNTASRGK